MVSRLFCENLTCLNLLKIAKNSSNKFFRLIDCLGTEIWRTYLKFSVKWRRHITTFNFKKESIHKTSDNRLFSAAGPAFLSLEIKIFHHKNVSLKRLDSVPLSLKAVVSLLRRQKLALKGLKLKLIANFTNFTLFSPTHGHVTGPTAGGDWRKTGRKGSKSAAVIAHSGSIWLKLAGNKFTCNT